MWVFFLVGVLLFLLEHLFGFSVEARLILISAFMCVNGDRTMFCFVGGTRKMHKSTYL